MHVGWICSAVAFALTTACGRPAPPAAVSSPPSAAEPAAAAPPQPASAVEGGAESGHEHAAPHGGTLVELGDEFAHIELVLDAASGTLTAYSLDGEAEAGVRLAQPAITVRFVRPGEPPREVTLPAIANPLTGETATDSSQFRAIIPALKGATTFDGSIARVVVRGTQFDDVAFRFPSDGHQ